MRGLSGPKGRETGLRICTELIDHMADRADGFYIVPAQVRTEMAADVVAHLKPAPAAGRAGPDPGAGPGDGPWPAAGK
jgi:hypothetical protein